MSSLLYKGTVVHFKQSLGAAHSKCCQEMLFSQFGNEKRKKRRKGRKEEKCGKMRQTCVFCASPQTLAEGYIYNYTQNKAEHGSCTQRSI